MSISLNRDLGKCRIVMSGVCKISLWLGCGKNSRHKSENSYITEIDKVMMPPIELLKCWHQFSYLISLIQQSCREQPSSFGKVLGPVVQS